MEIKCDTWHSCHGYSIYCQNCTFCFGMLQFHPEVETLQQKHSDVGRTSHIVFLCMFWRTSWKISGSSVFLSLQWSSFSPSVAAAFFKIQYFFNQQSSHSHGTRTKMDRHNSCLTSSLTHLGWIHRQAVKQNKTLVPEWNGNVFPYRQARNMHQKTNCHPVLFSFCPGLVGFLSPWWMGRCCMTEICSWVGILELLCFRPALKWITRICRSLLKRLVAL